MSLTKINSKANKGKQKAFPKLKAILANPNKTRCPVLDGAELDHLKHLLQCAIQDSKLEPRAFATKTGICLGLESSLRKINNQTSSCVVISLSLKPNYIIGLIARNAQFKDGTQPVFAQPKLENFTQDIFGVQAMCMVFSKDLLTTSEKLNSWVEARRKPQKCENLLETSKIRKKNKRKKAEKIVELEDSTSKANQLKTEIKTKPEGTTKSCSGDFISFASSNSETKSKLDGNEVIDALTEIIDKLPTSTKTNTKDVERNEHMEVDGITDLPTFKIESNDTDSDDFLDEYKALTVHKLKGNPNKKPKKKRKKNKKKNKINT